MRMMIMMVMVIMMVLVLVLVLVMIMRMVMILQVDSLRKGRSRVIEANHTLIIGWGDKLVPIIQQIALANER
jgi:ion channel POLLUX/CASTOR